MFGEVFYILKRVFRLNPFYVFSIAVGNVSPLIRLKLTGAGASRRFSIFLMENEDKRAVYTIQWLFESLRQFSNTRKLEAERVARVILDAFENHGLWVGQK